MSSRHTSLSLEERRTAFEKNVKDPSLRKRLIARTFAHSHFCNVLKKKEPTVLSRRILEKVVGQLPKSLYIAEGKQFLDEGDHSFTDDVAVIGVLDGEERFDDKEEDMVFDCRGVKVVGFSFDAAPVLKYKTYKKRFAGPKAGSKLWTAHALCDLAGV